MDLDLAQVGSDLQTALRELMERKPLNERQILVVGTSTSEVLGVHIGKGGSTDVAETLFTAIQSVQSEYGFQVAFQCCEHLNRALVVERTTQDKWSLTEVSAVPAASAGGAMATYAYDHMEDPVLVEHLLADAGVDIGDTLIGMHLKPVAVPVRSSIKQIGSAHLTMALTRPKLIGGERAVYKR